MSISEGKAQSFNSNGLNIIIVDDEVKSAENIRKMLLKFVDPGINIMGVAHNTTTAERLISEFSPDAILLDIEMPHENAFHFLDRISPVDFEVIFITAYDKYAIRAIKLDAIDYILKPISIPELQNAISRLTEKIKANRFISEITISHNEASQNKNTQRNDTRIVLKDANHDEDIDPQNIFFIEAQRSYSRILFKKKNAAVEIIMSHPLAYYEEILSKQLFYRVHKSYLINCMQIEEVIASDNYSIVLKNKHKISISRRRYPDFIKFLKENSFYVA
jgi:two-component system, LytTR family, response regulator